MKKLLENSVPKPERRPASPRKQIVRSRIKKKARSKQEDERIYGTREFRAHLHHTPCLGCGVRVGIQQAHFGKHPLGKKNDWTQSGPLCHTLNLSCHDRYDRRGSSLLWFTHGEREVLEARLLAFHALWRTHLRLSGGAKAAPDVPSRPSEQ